MGKTYFCSARGYLQEVLYEWQKCHVFRRQTVDKTG